MARIPLTVGQRGLDTGSVVQYPSGSPIGAAIAGFGGALQGVAEHIKQKQEQKDAFDTTIRENELAADLAGMEDEAVQNAPADANGLHDSVYGQIDPVTHTAVKPGSFDKLFDSYLERVPESKRQEFAAKREVYRLRGSNKLAQAQYQGEQRYYNVEIQKTQNQITNAMAMGDPNDTETFETFKKQGLDIIDKSGLPALEKDVAKTNWLANADETLFKIKLAKDPAFAENARAALGLAPPTAAAGNSVDTVVNRIIGAESGGDPNAKNPNSSARGLGQFIDSTWLATVRAHRPDIAAGKSAAQILALKTNGPLAREMTTALTRDNAEYLTNRGIQTTPGNLYLAHFLGSAGAVQVLKANPGSSVASIVGQDAMRANPFLAGKTASDLAAWAAKKMGGPAPSADPAFANIPLERRLVLANQADVQVGEIQRTAAATAKAEYTGYKDALELQIVQGQVKDEALISGDGILNDGDKATLLRSMRTQNDTANQIQSDLVALNDRTLTLDGYSSKDKTRADNLYSDAAKRLPAEQHGAIAGAILEQTGVVPQPVVNSIRKGLSSTNVADVVTASQTAQRISTFDPAALARRDGGSEAQKAADDFGFYVNTLNLTPEEAARRMIDNRDPAKQRDRKAIEPAAKEFVKSMQDFDLASQFDDSVMGWRSNPSLGVTPTQEIGIKADFLAIAEDQFYQANGDPDLAKNRAVEEMKRLYGVTELGGVKAVVKHPPERYWPKSSYQGPVSVDIDPNNPGASIGAMAAKPDTSGDPSLDYAKRQLADDVKSFQPDADPSTIQLVTTRETDAMVKRGELPGYAVLYRDKDGMYQAVPGKLWRPDTSKAMKVQQEADQAITDEAVGSARDQQDIERQKAIEQGDDGGRASSLDAFTAGPVKAPVTSPVKETAADKVQADRKQLFDKAKEDGLSPASALSGNDDIFGAR